MNEAFIEFIEYTRESEQELASSDNLFDIYDDVLHKKEDFDYTPHAIFFNYIKMNDDGTLCVDHYFYPEGDPTAEPDDPESWPEIENDPTVLAKHIKDLAENASGLKNDPAPYKSNFNGLLWKRRAYIVFFFDETNWKLVKYTKGGKNRRAIMFYPKKNGKRLKKNHTFTNARDLDIDLKDNKGKRTAVVMINHLKRGDGKTLGKNDPVEPFEFGMLLDVKYEDSDDSSMTVIFDPGGTNEGPPLDP